MLAKYTGKCGKCGLAIHVGDSISWSRQERGKVYHLACKDPVAVPTPIVEVAAPVPSLTQSQLMEAIQKLIAVAAPAPVATPVVAVEDEEPGPEEFFEPSLAPTPVLSVPVPAKPAKVVSVKLNGNSPWYEVFACVLPAVNRLLLMGPPSTGKSTTAMKLAGIKHRVTMTETTSREDLIGMFHLIDGATQWVDGPFTMAMRNGEAVLIDEIDRYSPECASLLYSLIDDRPHVSLPNGELVEAASGYKVIMTTNEVIDTLPVAVQDRIECIVQAVSPHPAALEPVNEAAREVVTRYYSALPVPTIQLRPSVRRMRSFYNLIGHGIPNELAGALVFGKYGAKEVLSAITSAESGS